MNAFRISSRVLVVTAVVLGGSLYCVDFPINSQHISGNKYAVLTSLIESQTCKKDDHFKKACIDTLGHTLDAIENNKRTINDGREPINLLKSEGINLGANYVIRKSGEFLHDKHISLNSVGKKCDVLPEGMIRDTVNPVIRGAAEVATHPQMIIFLAGLIIAAVK